MYQKGNGKASLYLIRKSIFCSFGKNIHENILVPSLVFLFFFHFFGIIHHGFSLMGRLPSCPLLSRPWLWTTYLNKTIFNSFKRNFTCGANVMSLPLPFPFDKNVPYLILRCPSTSGYGLPPPPCPKPLWEAICIQLAFHLLIIRN